MSEHMNSQSWAAHLQSEFQTLSVEDALATMVPEPYVNHIPTLTGGRGEAELRRILSRSLHRAMASGYRHHAAQPHHGR